MDCGICLLFSQTVMQGQWDAEGLTYMFQQRSMLKFTPAARDVKISAGGVMQFPNRLCTGFYFNQPHIKWLEDELLWKVNHLIQEMKSSRPIRLSFSEPETKLVFKFSIVSRVRCHHFDSSSESNIRYALYASKQL